MNQQAISIDPSLLGIKEFSTYSLIIDARTPHEYADDHIPGAVNLPVVSDSQFAEVGIAHAREPHAAYLMGAQYATRNLADHIRDRIAAFSSRDRFLVYCFRGGKRSRVWADTLRNIGFETDVLQGGWKRYRGWVRSSLDALPPTFEYRVVSGLTGCGKTRLLHALAALGNQVLDLEGLASHRGSLLGAVPGAPQPSQKMFDSVLLDKLRGFDPGRPVWVEAESKKVGNLHLPESLFDAMRRAPAIHVTAPMGERVRLLREDYPQFAQDLGAMVERLVPLKPLVGSEELALWRRLAGEGEVDRLFERLLVSHYDPSYERSRRRTAERREPVGTFEIFATDPARLESAARALTNLYGARVAQ